MPRNTLSAALVCKLALLCCACCVGAGLNDLATNAAPDPEPRAVDRAGDLSADELRTISLFENASPSVCFITSIAFQRNRFTLNVQAIPRGTGSGFVWSDAGHIVTNYHVIQYGKAFQVTLFDGSTWDATVVGYADEKDLAVLKIDAPRKALRPIPIGRSSDLRVGQKVLAIGNPFGLDQTLTTGVISALGREIESVARTRIQDVIQTDAAINPGNSGGPLLDSSGRLIGVNTSIYSPSGASAGVGFAIPVDTVNWVVPELIKNKRLLRPTIGITMRAANTIPNLDVDGLIVIEVFPDSGAERAGLRPTTRDRRNRILWGDIIQAIDGKPVASSDDLILALDRRKQGEVIELTILRGGKKQSLEVTLGPPSR